MGSTVEQQPVGKLVQQSFGEAPRVKLSKPTQPKPKPICDRSGKPDKLSENIRVKHAHDGMVQPVEQSSSSTQTVKEQFVPEENRDIASFNADNEFRRNLMILYCRTMLRFRADSSNIYTTQDVRSIFILLSTMD